MQWWCVAEVMQRRPSDPAKVVRTEQQKQTTPARKKQSSRGKLVVTPLQSQFERQAIGVRIGGIEFLLKCDFDINKLRSSAI